MTSKHQQRRGLGRGLGSLIPTAPNPPPAIPDTPTSGEPGDGPQQDPTGGGAGDRAGDWAGDRADGSAGPIQTMDRTADQAGDQVSDQAGDQARDQAGDHGPDREADQEGTESEPAHSQPAQQTVAGAYFAELPVVAITANPRQPRQVFEEEAMAELVHSVTEVGLLQPVVVRKVADGAYELIMGERRWRATQEAGLETIPAIVRETGDDAMLRDALLENLHRAELNPLEEAAAYEQLLDDFGCTHEELASRIGRSRPQISNTLRLLRLSPAVQRRVAAGVLSAGHARALLAVDDGDIQDRLAGRVVSEGISVRGLEEIVAVGGLGAEQKARPRPGKPTAPALADLSARLSDRFETRVKVDLGRSKGKITVEFATIDDLERIVAIMDPRNRADRPI